MGCLPLLSRLIARNKVVLTFLAGLSVAGCALPERVEYRCNTPTGQTHEGQHQVDPEDLGDAFNEVLTEFPVVLDYLRKNDPRAEAGVFPVTYKLLNALTLLDKELLQYFQASGSFGAGGFLISYYMNPEGRLAQLQHLAVIAQCRRSRETDLALRVLQTFDSILPGGPASENVKPSAAEEEMAKAILLGEGPKILAEFQAIHASFAPAILAHHTAQTESSEVK